MFKLLIAIVTFLLLGLAVMGMRHHRRELESQTAMITDQITAKKEELGGQRPLITSVSSPPMLAKSLQSMGLAGEVGVVDKSRPKTVRDPGNLLDHLQR